MEVKVAKFDERYIVHIYQTTYRCWIEGVIHDNEWQQFDNSAKQTENERKLYWHVEL